MSETAAQQHRQKHRRGSLNKRESSNQKRLQALRQKTIEAKAGLPLPAGKHTVFDSDSGGSIGDSKEDAIPLFGESDSSSSSDEDRRFSEHRSKKIMHLQRRIGPDKRFRLDERFAGSDSDDEDSSSCIPVNELEAEKQQALRILNSLVSPTTATRSKEATLQQVYDPGSDQSRPSTLVAADTSDSSSELLERTDEHLTTSLCIPTVSNERFYSINQDLKSGLTEEPFTFEFVEEDHQETLQSPQAEQHIHSLPVHHTPVTESGSIENMQQKISSYQHHLFFHWNHPTMCNRRAEGHFFREKSVEELMSGWDLRRTSVKTQYKRARKDALRKKSRHQ